jgi:threonine dehydrogenase-like Zn-dependent dehydrogenase
VAVFAQGPVGLAATIGCGLLGAGQIIAVEGRPERQQLARGFGADIVLDPADGHVVERIRDLTGGDGVDAAIEAFGFPETFDAAVRATRPGGRISNIGCHGENPEPLPIALEPFGMGMSDKKILTVLCPGAASGSPACSG